MLAFPVLLAAALAAPASRPPDPPEPGAWTLDEPGPAEAEALRALARVAAGEPTAAEVQAAAARRAEAGSERRDGPRLAALLPRVTVELRHDERSDRVLGLQGSGEVDYVRAGPGNAVLVRATWDLPLLAAGDRDRAAPDPRRRDEVVRRATDAYFERRRLRLALLLDPPRDARARAEAELAVDRLTAELDALTGGLFAERR